MLFCCCTTTQSRLQTVIFMPFYFFLGVKESNNTLITIFKRL